MQERLKMLMLIIDIYDLVIILPYLLVLATRAVAFSISFRPLDYVADPATYTFSTL